MSKNLSGKKLGIIHAALISTGPAQRFAAEVLPGVEVVHFVDDTIQNTNFACAPGVIPPKNYAKFVNGALSQEEYGVDLTPHLEIIKTTEPGGRKAGVKVKDVAELIAKLKTEAGVI